MATWSIICSLVALCAAVGCFRLLLILSRHVSLLAGAASNALDNNERKSGRKRMRGHLPETRRRSTGAHQSRSRVDPQGSVFSSRFEKVWVAFDRLLDRVAVVEHDANLDNDANLSKGKLSASMEDAVAAGIAAAEQKMALAFQAKMAQAVMNETGKWRVMQESREAWWQRKFDLEENKLGTALAAAVASHEDAMEARERKCTATVDSVRADVLQLKEQAAGNAARKAADDASAREKAAMADLLRAINATHQMQQEAVVAVQQEVRECLARRKVEEASSASRGDPLSAAAEASPRPPSMDDTTKLRNVKSDLDSLGARLLALENAGNGLVSPRKLNRTLHKVHESVLESIRVWGEEPLVGPVYTEWVLRKLKKNSSKIGPGSGDEGDEKTTPREKSEGGSGKGGSTTEGGDGDGSSSNDCMPGGGEGGQGRAPSS
ncbi:unnamed protein product [Ectocarpus sp. CCAP 1310/34]|nr:unnamed protein product [Ectocarpus sp. CCAP 1310/34]